MNTDLWTLLRPGADVMGRLKIHKRAGWRAADESFMGTHSSRRTINNTRRHKYAENGGIEEGATPQRLSVSICLPPSALPAIV